MDNKNTGSDKFTNFLEGKGFYIILAVCLCIIGASGYVLFSGGQVDTNYIVNQPPQPKVDTPASNTVPDITVSEPIVPIVEPKPLPEPNTPAKPIVPPTPEPEVYLPPVVGEVAKVFSDSQLVFDNTMEDFRTHNGIDILCPSGTAISTFAKGKVESVYYDELVGHCVVIKHSDGIKSVYKGMAEGIPVKEGERVEPGDIIGATGDTNLTETLEQPHLHFEVTKNGKYIDPLSVIK